MIEALLNERAGGDGGTARALDAGLRLWFIGASLARASDAHR